VNVQVQVQLQIQKEISLVPYHSVIEINNLQHKNRRRRFSSPRLFLLKEEALMHHLFAILLALSFYFSATHPKPHFCL
jgi:hypothetical protein